MRTIDAYIVGSDDDRYNTRDFDETVDSTMIVVAMMLMVVVIMIITGRYLMKLSTSHCTN